MTKRISDETEPVEAPVKTDAGLAAKVRGLDDKVTKIVKSLEKLFGVDIDRDGKVGGARVWTLVAGTVCVGLLLVVAALAETISMPFLDDTTYGTAKVVGNSSTAQGGFTGDDLTAEDDLTVSDDAAIGDQMYVAGAITGASVTASSMTIATLTASAANISGAITGATATVATLTAGAANVSGAITGATATVSTLTATTVAGGAGNFSGAVTGATVTAGTATLAAANVAGAVTGATVTAATLTAGAANVSGAITGTSVTVASANVGGTVTGSTVLAEQVTSSDDINCADLYATGTITGSTVVATTLTVPSTQIVRPASVCGEPVVSAALTGSTQAVAITFYDVAGVAMTRVVPFEMWLTTAATATQPSTNGWESFSTVLGDLKTYMDVADANNPVYLCQSTAAGAFTMNLVQTAAKTNILWVWSPNGYLISTNLAYP